MNILMITSMFPTPHEQFNGISVYNTARLLREKYHYRFKIIYPVPYLHSLVRCIKSRGRERSKLPGQWNYDGFDIEFPRFIKTHQRLTEPFQKRLFDNSIIPHVLTRIKEVKPDLIWVQPSIPHGWIARHVKQKLGIPYVIVVHGWDINVSTQFEKDLAYLKLIYEDADAVIGVSQFMKEQVLSINESAKAWAIPNGTVTGPKKKDYDLENRSLKIISVSNLNKTKGIEFNLHAMKILKSQDIPFTYEIIGDGSEWNHLKQLRDDLGLSKEVFFSGKLEHAKMLERVSESDIFSLPSYKEGLGLVYLEAMSCGVPIIGINDQGISTVVENGVNGFLVDPMNSEQIADVIINMHHHRELIEKVGCAGRKKVLDNFTWDKIVPLYHDILGKITQ